MRKTVYLYIAVVVLLALTMVNKNTFAQGNNANLTALVDGNTDFAFKFYHTISDQAKDNLIYSPYSLSEAFAMVYAGAQGDTELAMRKTLDYRLTQADIASTFKLLSQDIVSRGNHTPKAAKDPLDLPRALRIANGIWIEKTFPVKQSYQDQMKLAFDAGLQQADFGNAPDAERDKINQWVQQQTENRIKDILPPGTLTPATKMVLANAIYFMNAWQYPFGEQLTTSDSFFLVDGTSIQVPMMTQDEAIDLSYVKEDDADLVALPYLNSGTSMVIFMPDTGKFADFEKALDGDRFRALMSKLDTAAQQKLHLYLPRFKFEYSIDLSEPLKTLGMGVAFSGAADFGGISDQHLEISKALQKAFIGVDEKGTEAAAATVIVMAASLQLNPPPILDLKIDRPFIFFIEDKTTHSILFMGRVLRPVEE